MIRLNKILEVTTPLILGISAALLPMHASAKSCTDGVDCYCDRVRNPADVLYDPVVLVCEDWEAVTLHDNVNVGGGSPLHGPWYDDTGYAGARGVNSYWTHKYPGTVNSCSWRSSSPGAYTRGTACTYPTCYAGEWSAGDTWTANSFACLDIVQNGEFDDEVSSEGAGPIKPDGTRGVWDGQQTMGFRVGAGKTAGITGTARFGKTVTDLGLTMALAYSPNSGTSKVWIDPWKHDEYRNASGELAVHWNLGRVGAGGVNARPYSSAMYNATYSSATRAACEAAVANATITVGTAGCHDSGFYWGAGAAVYTQSVDFPWGTWGCHQAHISGLNTSNVSLRLWHDNVLVFEMTGFDGAVLRDKGFQAVEWDHYANANQPGASGPTIESTRRYQDNIHYREGAPVSCQAIGFGAGAAAPPAAPLAAPTLLP